jgi:hypothetical protein
MPKPKSAEGVMRTRDDKVIVIYLLFVVLLFRSFFFYFNSTIFFNDVGWLDPYMYIGIGLYYGIPDFFANHYKISRVPWNILEFLTRQTLLPESATYVLQSSIAALTSVAIFVYFRNLIGKPKSFLLASFSIFFPLLHAGGGAGADYHNGFSAALYFLTLAFLVTAILHASKCLAFLAGATIAATVHTNPLFILLAPMTALHAFALCLERNRSVLFILYAASFALGGAVVTTVLLGLVHIMLGRSFFFFLPQWTFIFGFLKEGSDIWMPMSWEWIRNSKENAYLLSVFILCSTELIIIAVQKTIGRNLQAIAAYGGFIITYVIALAYQLKGQTALQPDYFCYSFIAATITPIGYFAKRYFPASSNTVLVYVGFPLLCALSLIFSDDIQRALSLFALPPFLGVVSVSATAYVLIILLSMIGLDIGIVLLAALIGVLVNSPQVYKYDSCHSARHLNILISTVSRMSTELATRPQSVFVWFDRAERAEAQPCFKQLKMRDLGSSLVFTGHNYLGEPYGATQLGEFTRETFAQAEAVKGIIVLVTANDRVKAKFTEAAASLAVDLHLKGLYQDPASGVKFFFWGVGTDRSQSQSVIPAYRLAIPVHLLEKRPSALGVNLQ